VSTRSPIRPRGDGQRPRLEDERLLRGEGSFVADVRLPGMLEVAVLRSPLPHARIRGVRLAAARAMPGVALAVGAADLDGLAPYPDLHPRTRPVRQLALAADRVRYVGAPVAAVAAEDRYLAEDAIERIEVDYEELPAVTSIDEALAPDAPRLFDDWPDNRIISASPPNTALDEAFASAARIVRGTYRMGRHTAVPLEGRGVLASWDRGRLTVWTSTQVAHIERTILARALGLPEHRIRVVVGDVGGSFGGKLHVYREDALVAWMAMRLRRPVRWIEDRREHLVASSHAREQRHDLEMAVDQDGNIIGVRAAITCDVGSGEILPPGTSPSFVSAASLTGPYRIPLAQASVTCVVTNKAPSGAYRGFGTPEMVFALERHLERVARETGQDPVELRRRLLIRPEDLPYETPGGRRIDSGSHLEAFERAVSWATEARARLAPRARGSLGVGFASYLEGVAPNYFVTSGLWTQHETCTLRIEPDGSVVVSSGLGPMGQGTETMLATLASELLGVPIERVAVRLGDTDLTPVGLGSFGSRSTVVAAGALTPAAEALRRKVAAIAGSLLECRPEDLLIEDGRVHVAGSPEPSVSLAQVAEVAWYRTLQLPEGVDPGLEATATFDARLDHRPDARGKVDICLTYANATHAAIVDVDPGTGEVAILGYLAVHDAGPLLDPAIVDGQVRGGVAQGIGGALSERLVYSEDGQPLVTGLMDYLMPTAVEIPEVTVVHLETPSPVTPFGLKGAGEAGATGCAAAIANAVADALRDLELDIDETPITPALLRRLVRERTSGGGGEGPTAVSRGRGP
jgi:carbon-monoxide dehydrogenase large subunit